MRRVPDCTPAASCLILSLCPAPLLLLLQVYGADEAFATGTFAGLLPVVEVDGRKIGTGGASNDLLLLSCVDTPDACVASGAVALA